MQPQVSVDLFGNIVYERFFSNAVYSKFSPNTPHEHFHAESTVMLTAIDFFFLPSSKGMANHEKNEKPPVTAAYSTVMPLLSATSKAARDCLGPGMINTNRPSWVEYTY